MAKVTEGITATHFIYDTQYRVIEERDDVEALLARYTYGQGMDEPLTMERDGETYYYHRDALGSITEVTDSNGTLVERYEYDVYGEVSIFDGSDNPLAASAIGNPYLFTGRRYDCCIYPTVNVGGYHRRHANRVFNWGNPMVCPTTAGLLGGLLVVGNNWRLGCRGAYCQSNYRLGCRANCNDDED